MYDPSTILTWLEEDVLSMQRSRIKTLAAIAGGAMQMQGSGVLALGRAMEGPTAARHRIKRVDRFLGNAQVEVDAVSAGLFHQLRRAEGPVVVLADWTAISSSSLWLTSSCVPSVPSLKWPVSATHLRRTPWPNASSPSPAWATTSSKPPE